MRETKAAEAGVELWLSVTAAAQRGIAAVAPGAPVYIGPQRSELLDPFRKLMTAAFALTYEKLTDADLVAYVSFLKSPAGQRFNNVSIRALNAAMSDATEDFARSIPATKDAATPKSATGADQGSPSQSMLPDDFAVSSLLSSAIRPGARPAR